MTYRDDDLTVYFERIYCHPHWGYRIVLVIHHVPAR